jgi:hypothetical protein
MGGMRDIDAFREVGLDAAITFSPFERMESADWRVSHRRRETEYVEVSTQIETPGGTLTCRHDSSPYTTWVADHLIKRDEDIYLYEKYGPRHRLDNHALSDYYDEVGEDGIMRMFIIGYQGGCWQDACELVGTENMILATFDKPDWVHELLRILLEEKLRFIYDEMKGARVDLVETGGGASSNTVISPSIHSEFCVPYDRKLHDALHDVGHSVVYHTCGGMMALLDLIPENNCDVSETLSPPGVGGDITDPLVVKESLGRKVSLIGGLDQFNILGDGTETQIRDEVWRLFRGFGREGGYVMSASDHFFDVPVDNLRIYADAAIQCVY